MATSKKVVGGATILTKDEKEETPQAGSEETEESRQPKGDLCGHENKHWTGKGKQTCQLKKGHVASDINPSNLHMANYVRYAPNPDPEKPPLETKDISAWHDDASISVAELSAPVEDELLRQGAANRAAQAKLKQELGLD